MLDFDGTEYNAYYNNFKVGPEHEGYRMFLSEYNATGSTLADGLSAGGSSGAAFTTSDMDNDERGDLNCATNYTGGEWCEINT